MLDLFCMYSYDSETGLIFQRFSRSTRFTYLRTAQTSKIQSKFGKLFAKLNIEYSIFLQNFSFFQSRNFAVIFRKIINSSTFYRISSLARQILAFSRNFGEIPTKFHQNLASKRQNSTKKCRKLNIQYSISQKV